MLPKNAGVELGNLGARVVNIAPGAVDTPINQQTATDPVKLEQLKETIPVGRLTKPEQIAEAVLFAASTAGSYLPATTITVDGGISVHSTGLWNPCPPAAPCSSSIRRWCEACLQNACGNRMC